MRTDKARVQAENAALAGTYIAPLVAYIQSMPNEEMKPRDWLKNYKFQIDDRRVLSVAVIAQIVAQMSRVIDKGGIIQWCYRQDGKNNTRLWRAYRPKNPLVATRRSWAREFRPYVPPKTVVRESGRYALDRNMYANDYSKCA